APGDSAWPIAAIRNPPHLRGALRPDLHAARQYLTVARRAVARRSVPLIERAGVRVWNRRHRHHGGYRHDGFRGGLENLALAPGRGGSLDRAVPVHRPDVPCCQPAQGGRGRLDAAVAWRMRHGGDVYLAPWHPVVIREDPAAGD